MNDSSNVNKTHILVLKEMWGRLFIDTIPIEDSSYICTEIENAAKNPNMTVLDVQTIFNQELKCLKDYYPYLYPYSYGDSYICRVKKPNQYTYKEYQKELNKGTNECKNRTEKEKKILHNQKILKLSYITDDCTRYIHQEKMYEAFQKAENDPSVKMYSREAIGWNGFTYKITDDIIICVSTNFGYGYVSYFLLTASYKDIVIAPITHLVNYYKAQMVDIIQCTRSYWPIRDSWYPVLDFVKDFANQSLSNPEQFVKKYIMNEVDYLMRELRNIMVNPQGVIDKFKRQMNNLPDEYHRLRFIYPMSDKEKECYDLFPRDMPIVFKSEKLIGAVEILEKLKELTAIYAKISDYINEIIGMVNQLKSEVEEAIERMQEEIASLKEYRSLINQQQTLKWKIDSVSSELNQVLLQNTSEAEDVTTEEIVARFNSLHEQMQDVENLLQEIKKKCEPLMKDKKEECKSIYEKIETRIADRVHVRNRLSSFSDLYSKHAVTFDNVG